MPLLAMAVVSIASLAVIEFAKFDITEYILRELELYRRIDRPVKNGLPAIRADSIGRSEAAPVVYPVPI
jgi:hypothetical protein